MSTNGPTYESGYIYDRFMGVTEIFICLPMTIASVDGYAVRVCVTCRFREEINPEKGRYHLWGISRAAIRY